MQARVRDTEIFFDIDGAGWVLEAQSMRARPTGFAIHGGPGADHSSSKRLFQSLTRKMQLVYFDHRGQGRSARGNPLSYTLEQNVEDMEALRRHLGLGPIVSIGPSYGGVVAMAHAARYPDAVSHLIVVVSAAHSGYALRAKQIVGERGTAQQKTACDEFFAGRLDTPGRMQEFFKMMGPLYAHSDDPELSKLPLDPAMLSPEALNRAHGPEGFMRSLDLRPELSRITAPTLIVAGRHDWICAPEFSEEMHRLIPGSQLHIFEESGHLIHGAALTDLLDMIAGFVVLKRNDSGDGRCPRVA